ncbi:MAG TPA: hypothetical protein VK166_16180 [Chitinophagaceae bacterium]|nr:hypothetical protein [Chitinophagaceae bacterium]
MAKPNEILINALRETASRLRAGATYAWGNHGACNCGHLLQVITPLSRQEIMSYAQTGIGEWTELAQDYCGVTNAPVDLLLSKLSEVGLTPSDVHHLEYLDQREVLENLPGGFRWLKKNERQDVIEYFESFADLLEAKLLSAKLIRESDSQRVREPEFCNL